MSETKKKILIQRPSGLGFSQIETDAYFAKLYEEMRGCGMVHSWKVEVWRSPWMARGRNTVAKQCIDEEWDYLLMVDPDMYPDLYVNKVPKQMPFFTSSMKFLEHGLLEGNAPGVVAAPYVGRQPSKRVHVFKLDETNTLSAVTHEKCVEMVNNPKFEHVAATGTGAMLISREVFEKVEPPWFEDTWKDKYHTQHRTTFDVEFGVRCYKAEVPYWCNWYSFAGHIQWEIQTCPGLPEIDHTFFDAKST